MSYSNDADASPRTHVVARILLAIYAITLTLIAFWPTPVDGSEFAGRIVGFLIRVVPGLTYERLEFGANIALFVPFGVLLALVFAGSRYLVVPTILVTSFTIECIQGLLIPDRTPSLYDILANIAGGCFGLLAVASYQWWRARVIRNALQQTRPSVTSSDPAMEYPPAPPG